jgi:hypothetical protein
MTALARRLDPCVNWFNLLYRTKGRILWIFPALLFVGYMLAMIDSAERGLIRLRLVEAL